ncbi:hypothetical protein Syncc8109_1746 [Synechococcus sp. WH 8109]|nr:hypothetical protein Syncc8109_1746 [Synechococcus sp. WH 8109]
MLKIQLNSTIRRYFKEITRLIGFTFGETPNEFASTKTSIGKLCFKNTAAFIVHHMCITQHLSICSLNALMQSFSIGWSQTISRHPMWTFRMISRAYRNLHLSA